MSSPVKRINNKHMHKGYTLLELAIVFTVVGFFLAAGITAYHIYSENQATKTTQLNITKITSALNAYLNSNGRYPCPARLTDDRLADQATYGIEGDCEDETVAVGTCTAGICIEEAEVSLNLPGNSPIFSGSANAANAQAGHVAGGGNANDNIPVFPRVRRGAIPFRTLNIDEDTSYDGYNSKLEYVVTEHMAVEETFDTATDGGDIASSIAIIDNNGNTVLAPNGAGGLKYAQFIIISHGKDKNGAYTRYGKQISPCGATKANENCNTATDSRAIYRTASKNLSGTAEHFDDFLSYEIAATPPLWKITDGTGLHISDLADTDNDGGAVGVQDNALDDEFPTKLFVRDSATDPGIIRTEDQIHNSNLCEQTGNDDCFPPSLIAGTAMTQCNPATEYMAGVVDGAPDCRPLSNLALTCPDPGELMTGIDANMQPICTDAPAICPAITATVCNGSTSYETDFPLAQAQEGTYQRLPATGTIGFTRYEEWHCGSGGYWHYDNRYGSCNCIDQPTEVTTPPCGVGWTGNEIFTSSTITCDWLTRTTSETPSTTDRSACQCAAVASTLEYSSCGPGYAAGGQITNTTEFVCDTSDLSQPGVWVDGPPDSSACVCEPATNTDRWSCPSGEFDSDDGTAFGLYMEQYFTCAGNVGTWDAGWTEVDNKCVCDPTYFETRAGTCPDGQYGSITERRDVTCVGGAAVPLTESDWYPLPATSTCQVQVCNWNGLTTPISGPQSGQNGTVDCSCGEPNQSCYFPASGGGYTTYTDCKCQ